jgi:hypothetical protein
MQSLGGETSASGATMQDIYREGVDSAAGSLSAAQSAVDEGEPMARGALAKQNKFNKIGSEGGGANTKSPTPTPLLDTLPPLRRAQFLQVVLRQVKATNGDEAHKMALAEEFLEQCNGDCNLAFKHVKDLTQKAEAR